MVSRYCLPEPLGISPINGLELLILALEGDAHLILSNAHSSVKEIGGKYMVAVSAIVADASVINSQRSRASPVKYSSVKMSHLDGERCWLGECPAVLLPFQLFNLVLQHRPGV